MPSHFVFFFPVGIVVSILGVGLWPMLYAGMLSFPPHVPHARAMVEGFFGAFVIGFLGTALPRMMETPPLRKGELGTIFVLYLGAVGMQLTGRVAWGDGFFLAVLIVFLLCMGTRFSFLRRDLPPPGFVLAAMAGVAMLLAGQVLTVAPFQQKLGELLLYEGFVLFPILGVGVFFFPRLLGLIRGTSGPSATWKSRLMVAAGCGALLWGSFGMEAGGMIREGRLLRAIVAGVFLLREVPLFRKTDSLATVSFSSRVAVVMIFVGLLVTGLFPAYQKGFDHLMFIGGFGLVVLTVASRVVLGHAERLDLATGRSVTMRWVVWMLLVAAATRATADPLPHFAVSHHIYAALFWTAAAAIWEWWVFWCRPSRRAP